MSEIKIHTGWEINKEEAYVTYADHVAALAAAVAEAKQRGEGRALATVEAPNGIIDMSYRNGVSDERERIRKAVKGMYGDSRNIGWGQMKRETLAVIDNEGGK